MYFSLHLDSIFLPFSNSQNHVLYEISADIYLDFDENLNYEC
jgi:hypothetical protein